MKKWYRALSRAPIERRHRFILSVAALALFASGAALAQSGPWETRTSMPTVRSAVAAAVDGKIYVIGGISESLTRLATVEEYDPMTDVWTTKTPMPTARFSHSACVVNGKIYVFGGQAEVFNPSLSTNQVYDPAIDAWETKSGLPRNRSQASATVVGGKIYIIGGQGGPANSPRSSIEEYNPVTDAWDTTRADMPTPRVFPGTSVVNGKIFVMGGAVSGAGGPGLNAVEVYDPVTDSWDQTVASMPTARAGVSTNVVSGIIYAIGGISAFAQGATFLAKVEAFDPATGTWNTSLTAMPTARYAHATAVVDGIIHAIGGDVAGFRRSAIVECYTPPNITSVDGNDSGSPMSFALHQNYPNPFNPRTTIAFQLPTAEHVELAVYNMMGQKIKTLIAVEKPAGAHTVSWDSQDNLGKGVVSGVYFYRLQFGDIVKTKKMILME